MFFFFYAMASDYPAFGLQPPGPGAQTLSVCVPATSLQSTGEGDKTVTRVRRMDLLSSFDFC